ncbi:site-specific integrase [Mesorhizobium sp. M4A.F.Ca.ET.050.02.1.1]|uniref:site-specific integrase n=1 Tax=Mesorhizobium sp. M4A.F.Ca.ET.050.02.1.1 TaxID=2496754 RepID=UPI001FDF14C6|nr:site-specific integrase [Mesorhizobium sp. M4A.F.Ca.ET.050.02.1.1]
MARRRKDYRLDPSPISLAGEPTSLVVNFLDPNGRLEESFDFSIYGTAPSVAAAIALAFRNHHAGHSPATREGAFKTLRRWFAFLNDHTPAITSMREVDTATLRAFIAWLDAKPWTKSSRHGSWSAMKQMVRWLKRNRPDLVAPDLEIPFNAFPRKNAETRPREALSRSEMEAVLSAARKDIEAIWSAFETGKALLSQVDREAIAQERDLSRLDLDDLGVVLAVIVEHYGGLVPPQNVTLERGSGRWRLHHASLKHGGNQKLTSYLHTLPETLIPYMIAIGAQSYANPEALRELQRGCMSNHLLLDGREVMTWSKGRSNRVQRRSFLRDKSMSVPNLVDQVLEMTASLIPYVPEQDRERLFLVASINGTRAIKLIPDYLVSRHVRLFAQRHGLVDENGAPLALTLAALRTTGLTLAHEALGHDILKTQILANHATPDTTQRYIDRPIVRKAQERIIGDLQLRFVQAVRGPDDDDDESDDDTPTVQAEYATAAGFICKDPLAGIGEGQKSGRLCTAWLGCFTCPNAVIPLDPDVLTRLLSTRDALVAARQTLASERWRLLYAPKLEILEHDILPRFSPELHMVASMNAAPALPVIE